MSTLDNQVNKQQDVKTMQGSKAHASDVAKIKSKSEQNTHTETQKSLRPLVMALALKLDGKLKQKPSKALKKGKSAAVYVDGKLVNLATYLDEDGKVYQAYAIGDGLSLSYSTLKYFFDIITRSAGDDALHHFMTSPTGIATIAAETILITGLSFLAARYDNKELKNKYLNAMAQKIVTLWPYMRDVLKIWKNLLKGFRSLLNILKWTHIYDPSLIIFPLAIALAIPAALNQIFYSWMRNQRKDFMKENQNLFKQIAEEDFSGDDAIKRLQELRMRIKKQSKKLRAMGLFTQVFSGTVYGLYLYMGILGLASFSTVILWPLAAICGFMVISFIAKSIYEEWDYQRRLIITERKCDLMLISRQIEALLHAKMRGETVSNNDLKKLLNEYHKTRVDLEQKKTLSNFGAAMFGIKNGLAIYGVLCAGLFTASLFMSLASVSFPPALIVGIIVAGLASVIGYVVFMVCLNEFKNRHFHQPEVEISKDYTSMTLEQRAEHIVIQSQKIDPEKLQSPRSWSEVFRSTFSAFGKSFKNTEFLFNFLQNVGEDGHYHDTPVMLGIGAIQTLLFCPVFFVRAFTKGFRDGATVDKPNIKAFKYTPPDKQQKPNKDDLAKPAFTASSNRTSAVSQDTTSLANREISYECLSAISDEKSSQESPSLTRTTSRNSFFKEEQVSGNPPLIPKADESPNLSTGTPSI